MNVQAKEPNGYEVARLALSEYPEDREIAATYIDKLTRNEEGNKLGKELWSGLLQDDDPEVRDAAFHRVWGNLNDGGSEVPGKSGPTAERMFAEDGLTWEEAMGLVDDYIGALKRAAQHAGPTALAETVTPSPAAPNGLPD